MRRGVSGKPGSDLLPLPHDARFLPEGEAFQVALHDLFDSAERCLVVARAFKDEPAFLGLHGAGAEGKRREPVPGVVSDFDLVGEVLAKLNQVPACMRRPHMGS